MSDKKVSIIEVRRNHVNNTCSLVFDSADLTLEIADEDKCYPAGTFFVTMSGSQEIRYAVIPGSRPKPDQCLDGSRELRYAVVP